LIDVRLVFLRAACVFGGMMVLGRFGRLFVSPLENRWGSEWELGHFGQFSHSPLEKWSASNALKNIQTMSSDATDAVFEVPRNLIFMSEDGTDGS